MHEKILLFFCFLAMETSFLILSANNSLASTLERQAGQAALPLVEAQLNDFFNAIKSEQPVSQALNIINEAIPLPPMMQRSIAEAVYKKYEPAILKLIFNEPIYTIEQPGTTDFEYDESGKYFSSLSNPATTQLKLLTPIHKKY